MGYLIRKPMHLNDAHGPKDIEPDLKYKMEDVHRVEFILWKDHIVCNVFISGHWRTCSVPNTITIAEFMAGGELERMKTWPVGRLYNHI